MGKEIIGAQGASVRGAAADKKSMLRHVPSVLIGVVAAVVTVIVLDHFRAERAAQTPLERAAKQPGPSERVVKTVVVEGRGLDRVAELERQMRELEDRLDAAKGDTEEEKPHISHEEAVQKMDEAFAAFDRDHERDATDPSWAPEATNNLTTSLTALGEEVGFKVGPTDCKTTTCRATVTFDDYGAAQAKGIQLVERTLPGLNCTQRMRWKPPADRSAPYSTELYLDCADLRAGVVQPLENNDT